MKAKGQKCKRVLLAGGLSLCFLAGAAGCNTTTYKLFPESFDVDKLMFTRVLAVDSVEHGDDKIRLTVGSRTLKGSADDPTKKIEILSSEGRTFFEATRNFCNRVDKEVFFGYLDYIVLGQGVAQLDPVVFMDGIFRDPSIRTSVSLVVCSNMTAEEFLTLSGTEEAFPAERLDNIFLGERLLSQSSHTEAIDSKHFFTQNSRIRTVDFLRDLNGISRTSIIPCLSMVSPDEKDQNAEEGRQGLKKGEEGQEDQGEELPEKEDDTQEEGEEEGGSADSGAEAGGSAGDSPQKSVNEAKPGNQMFALDGYAVFKDRLIGYLIGSQGRAVNFLLGRIYAGQLLVQDQDGHNISLEILKCEREWTPRWDDNGLVVRITINMETAITEGQGNSNIYTEDMLAYLTAQQNQVVKMDIENLLQFTKDNNCDLIGIGKLFAQAYPVRFKKKNLADAWATDGYDQVTFEVTVNSVIQHSKSLQGPLISEGR
ncbi:MAG: hypothetical protein FWG14_10665 [Peptococcaceae bacterium]|nr:hypothetical protein [Peptococcaceae bacterium]